jgi:pimeloyl-ACP methyl ester carboxylesterase
MPVVERSGLGFHVQVMGAGPPLAMLHGLLVGSLATWYFGAAPRLARRYRVLAYDMRGHGLSARPPAGYDLATLAADLGELLSMAGDGPAVLVGHSWGALTALRFALAQPERVARLVLVEAPLPPSRLPELDAFLAAAPSEQLAALPAPLAAAVQGGSRQGRKLLEQVRFLTVESSLLRDLAAEPDFPDHLLARVACPTLCVYGRGSGCLPAGERLARVIPGAELALLDGGHFLPAENAAGLSALLEARL